MKKLIFILKIAIIIGIIIHFTIKDIVLLSALIFYALPLPVLIASTLLVAFLTKKSSQKIAVIIALFLSVMWIKESYVSNAEVEKEGFEIVFWNAFHDRNFLDAFEVNGNIPDVLVLVEGSKKDLISIKEKYPNYYFHVSKEEIGIFSKAPIELGEEIIGEENSTFLDFKTYGFNFYVVDISAGVLKPRQKSMDFIRANISKNERTIVLGDFNTPYESVHFSSFKDTYVHAFSEKGKGFRETWFWNIPLLSIDHIWVSKDLEINQVEKINTFKSDHSMLRMFLKK
ncbi:MAG: endonuclease/exonuclease/phosphatase family protein [Flavobacteriaceae bacterium]|nr:endonuclease/exonuclease/phosphatase family protein [Flavobacteriaceae bacterium]